jgi:hypothetical protein
VELFFALKPERARNSRGGAAAFERAGVDSENAGHFGGAEGLFNGAMGR